MNYNHPAYDPTEFESEPSSGVDEYPDKYNLWSEDSGDEDKALKVIAEFGAGGNATSNLDELQQYGAVTTWEEFITSIPYWKLQAIRNFGDYYDVAISGKYTRA